MSLRTSEKKRNFLKTAGFHLSYESTERFQLGSMVKMEMWKRSTEDYTDELSIFFDSVDGNRCDFYPASSNEADTFSERNLISELKKRGFGEAGV